LLVLSARCRGEEPIDLANALNDKHGAIRRTDDSMAVDYPKHSICPSVFWWLAIGYGSMDIGLSSCIKRGVLFIHARQPL
jgi:hypothetical protein